MNKGFFVSCLAVAAAACLGYWIWSDAPSTSKKSTISDVGRELAAVADSTSEEPERFSSRESVEVIDLSRAFEPTGEELSLQNLLGNIEEIEFLPAPREVIRTFPDAGEEASSPPGGFALIPQPVQVFAKWHYAELLSNLLPLKGVQWPTNP